MSHVLKPDLAAPNVSNRLSISRLVLVATLLLAPPGATWAAFAITHLDEGEVITDLRILETTDTSRPDCGVDWHLLSVDLNHGSSKVGSGPDEESAFYLCYQKKPATDAVEVVSEVYVVVEPIGGSGSCLPGDLMLPQNISEGPERHNFSDYFCVRKSSDVATGLAGIMIHPAAPHEEVAGGGWSVDTRQFIVPGFAPWWAFNTEGTPLSVHVLRDLSDRSAAFFECGGLNEAICPPGSGFTGGVEGNRCDRGLDNVNGICVNAVGLRARERAAVTDYLETEAGKNATWAINNQRELAIDEPLNWFSQLGSHNAANNSSDGYTSPNQPFSITDQLRLGVRIFMIDVAWLGDAVRLVHIDDCCGTDRLFSSLVKELADWLDDADHSTDVIVVYTEDYTPTPESDYMFNDTIERYLGDKVFVLGRDDAPARWPTQREMLAAGKQIIFATQSVDGRDSSKQGEHGGDWKVQPDQPGGTTIFGERGPWIRFADLGWVKPHETTIESDLGACKAFDRARGLGFSRIEDGLRLPEQTLDEGEIKLLAQCNFPMISVNDIDQYGRINSIVWSWAPGQTRNGTHAAFSPQDGDRWLSISGPQASHHFACATPVKPEPLDRPVGDQSGYARVQKWKVTQATGSWEEGFAACQNEFEGEHLAFSVPVNGWQNENLKTAFDASKLPVTDRVWLNYYKGDDGWISNLCPDAVTYPGAAEICNNVDDNCNGLVDEDETGEDTDADRIPNACDNCVDIPNPNQTDLDDDSAGDHCDLNDGLVYILFSEPDFVFWQREAGHHSWNVYRGDLDTLISTGVYTQVPGSNPLADQKCELSLPYVSAGSTDPDSGKVAFYLTTGTNNQGESDLGNGRPNDNPCP